MSTQDGLLMRLEASTAAPRAARLAIRRRYQGRLSEERLNVLLLLASELVTNAIRHGGNHLRVSVEDHGSDIRVAVDQSAEFIQAGTPGDGGGWGLKLIDQLSLIWGHAELQTGDGSSVWFLMSSE